jgi:3-deoxy-D-manno-octulosonate 8-phosphate phosphatase (KDO 8-P phosphatase)
LEKREVAKLATLKGRIKLAVFDFDGVFTDNKVYVSETGQETVCCSRSDGLGLQALSDAGIDIIVLTAEKNPVVRRRCLKLGIPHIVAPDEKIVRLKKLLSSLRIKPENVCYVGNDIPDLECMEYCGYSIAVRNSHILVKSASKYVTTTSGGCGAVREACEHILEVNEGI